MPSGVSLAELFLANVDSSSSVDTTPSEVQQILQDSIGAAQRAWPEVQVTDEVFVLYWARRIPAEVSLSRALRGTHSSDLYLACACSNGNPAAMAAFDATYLRGMEAALSRMNLPEDAIDDTKQVLRHRLFVGEGTCPARIGDYSGRGSLRNWVRAAAVQVALKNLRSPKNRVHLEHDILCTMPSGGEDLEMEFLKSKYGTVFNEALGEVIASLPSRDRNLLRHHFSDGLTVGQISVLYHVHRATAARWIAETRETVASQTCELVMKRLHVGRPEVDSILRLVRSQLDTGLCALGAGERKDDNPE